MQNINSNTSIRNFPEIYNANNKELLDKIESYENRLKDVENENESLKSVLSDLVLKFKNLQNYIEEINKK